MGMSNHYRRIFGDPQPPTPAPPPVPVDVLPPPPTVFVKEIEEAWEVPVDPTPVKAIKKKKIGPKKKK